MTREQIEDRIKQIEDSLWYYNMKSRWTWEDRKSMWELEAERNELKKQL